MGPVVRRFPFQISLDSCFISTSQAGDSIRYPSDGRVTSWTVIFPAFAWIPYGTFGFKKRIVCFPNRLKGRFLRTFFVCFLNGQGKDLTSDSLFSRPLTISVSAFSPPILYSHLAWSVQNGPVALLSQL